MPNVPEFRRRRELGIDAAMLEAWCVVIWIRPGGRRLASWPMCGPGAPDLSVVERLALLQLAARRTGAHIAMREVSAALNGLLDLTGLRGEAGWDIDGGNIPSAAAPE
jgi:hypothetical protein